MISQYMFNQLVINPAYCGSRDALSITTLYRHQWAGMNGAPRTQSLFLHSPLTNPKNNFGFSVVHDRLGVSSHMTLYGSYAYRIDLGEKRGRLAFGLQGGLSLLQDRWTDVITDQPGDYIFGANSPTFLVPRAGFGVYYDTRTWYLGASVPYLLDYKNATYTQYVKNSMLYRPYLFAGGFLIRLNPDLLLRPSFLAKYIRSSKPEFDINANLLIKEIVWIGASFRTGDAIVGLLELQLNPQIKLGYSFDYSITPLQKYNNGSHEFMLRYEFGYKMRAMSPRYF